MVSENPKVTIAKVSVPDEDNSYSDSDITERTLANSFLHRIAARANIIPYYDVIRWVIDSVEIKNIMFILASGASFGSFKVEDLKAMYHLPDPQKLYNKEFVKEFADSNKVQSEPIKEWRKNHEKHKNESSGMYSVDSLLPPYCYATAMMCRLFGNDNSSRFSIQMVHLILVAVNSEIMDWAVILSDRIANRILEYRQDKTAGNTTPFFFCAYILDALCFNSEFPLLG